MLLNLVEEQLYWIASTVEVQPLRFGSVGCLPVSCAVCAVERALIHSLLRLFTGENFGKQLVKVADAAA